MHCLSLFLYASVVLSAMAAEQYSPIVREPIAVSPSDKEYASKPFVDGEISFFGGVIKAYTGRSQDVTSPIIDSSTGKRTVIGRLAQMKPEDANDALQAAKKAWNHGRGVWPQMSARERIDRIQLVVESLKEKRSAIVNVLMWEICKSADDAAAEFDRTMKFIDSTIDALKTMDEATGAWKVISGILSRVRRTAIGIMMCLGPFNYPFNETYATLIPALLAGNIVLMKIPNVGGLAHILTIEAYAKHLPPGTINFFSGSGRETMGPIMATGLIDTLAFIGGSSAADLIIKAHPHPHRLKIFLQLEGKNLGIVLPDADIDVAVKEVTIGSTNYNGQRCTAIKLVMLHKSVVEQFLEKFKKSVAALGYGLPWQPSVVVTPLPEPNKIAYLNELIADAVSKGASVINREEGGGDVYGGLMRPAIVYPVTSDMRLWHEEQFGPVIPIAVYEDLEEVMQYIQETPFGQQAAVFTTHASQDAGDLLDVLSNAVGRVNFNAQCGRSPDSLPFSGRRSSALGTMSVTEALLAFSIETLVATKESPLNDELVRGLEKVSKFLQPLDGAASESEEL
jgi:glyceraldehyde-3-phosphate dehydrogenase (NADP+)